MIDLATAALDTRYPSHAAVVSIKRYGDRTRLRASDGGRMPRLSLLRWGFFIPELNEPSQHPVEERRTSRVRPDTLTGS